MQVKTSVPDAVVIGRDDGHPLHVQATVHNGRRHLDLRPWRRSSVGFAPSGPGMTIDAEEIDALEHGLAELLTASDGGRQVARVVWDDEHGRRLRAEVEPFGTRFLARLGFWQRGRDSWHPVDDGLVLSADHLIQLRDVLRGFHSWVCDPDLQTALAEIIAAERELLRRWPVAGADWLTAEADRIAFHPRGIRITCTLIEQNDTHQIALCQWRRNESLWLPDIGIVTLDTADLDALLRLLAKMTDRHDAEHVSTSDTLACGDGSSLRLSVTQGEHPALLLEQEVVGDGIENSFESRLTVPLEYLPRFGRALAQSWSLLAATLPEEERGDLERLDALAVDEQPEEPALDSLHHIEPAPEHADDVAAAGTAAEPGAEALAAPDVEPTQEMPANLQAADPILERTVDAPVASLASSQEPGAVEERAPEPAEPPLYIALRTISLGAHRTVLSLQGSSDRPEFTLAWEDQTLRVPLDGLEEMLLGLRALYYDALRGRRGRVLVVGENPVVTIQIGNHGAGLYCDCRQEGVDRPPTLSFPASEIPLFLDAAEAALALR